MEVGVVVIRVTRDRQRLRRRGTHSLKAGLLQMTGAPQAVGQAGGAGRVRLIMGLIIARVDRVVPVTLTGHE